MSCAICPESHDGNGISLSSSRTAGQASRNLFASALDICGVSKKKKKVVFSCLIFFFFFFFFPSQLAKLEEGAVCRKCMRKAANVTTAVQEFRNLFLFKFGENRKADFTFEAHPTVSGPRLLEPQQPLLQKQAPTRVEGERRKVPAGRVSVQKSSRLSVGFMFVCLFVCFLAQLTSVPLSLSLSQLLQKRQVLRKYFPLVSQTIRREISKVSQSVLHRTVTTKVQVLKTHVVKRCRALFALLATVSEGKKQRVKSKAYMVLSLISILIFRTSQRNPWQSQHMEMHIF